MILEKNKTAHDILNLIEKLMLSELDEYEKGMINGYVDSLRSFNVINAAQAQYIFMRVESKQPFIFRDFYLSGKPVTPTGDYSIIPNSGRFDGILPAEIYYFCYDEIKPIYEFCMLSSNEKEYKKRLKIAKNLVDNLLSENRINQALYQYLSNCIEKKSSPNKFEVYEHLES